MERIVTMAAALALAKSKVGNSDRFVLGLVGKPGAGKSTLANYLIDNLPAKDVALIPMDGYHLSNKVLKALGRDQRKGAPDTFDVESYVQILKRIKEDKTETIYFPIFHREIEESVAAEGVIYPETKLVITEGNYLLHNSGGWDKVKKYLDETWFVEVDDTLRLERLISRHQKFGRTLEEAKSWVENSDEKNANLIEKTKINADYIFLNS